jgi:transposase
LLSDNEFWFFRKVYLWPFNSSCSSLSCCRTITQASIDLSPAFISGIKNTFPQAEITFDRFHVVKLLNGAMNKVRQQERLEHDELKGHKFSC